MAAEEEGEVDEANSGVRHLAEDEDSVAVDPVGEVALEAGEVPEGVLGEVPKCTDVPRPESY